MASAPIKTIDGRDYAFGRIPPTRSVPLQVQIAKLVGPEIQFLLSQDTGPMKADFEAKNWGSLLGKLAPVAFGVLQGADGEHVLKMMEVVFQYTNIGGKSISPEVIDATFGASNPATIWKVFFEGLRVNFAGFFPDVPSDSPAQKTT